MIRFPCECGRLLQAPDDYAGKQATCPSCNRTNTVPAGEPPAEAVRTARPDRAVQAEPRAGREDEEDRRPHRREREGEGQRAAAATSGKATSALVLGLLSCVCALNVVTGLPAVILGALALKDINKSRGRLGGSGLALTGIITGIVGMVLILPAAGAVMVGLLLPAVQKVREAAARTQSQNNLKQMGLAFHSHHDKYNRFPADAIRGKDGRPLLSWRVAILPGIGENALYKQFRLDEPWDSPHNSRLVSQMPRTYLLPNLRDTRPGYTPYRAFVGPRAVFDPSAGGGVRMTDITDGSSNTILVVEAAEAVPWTKPDELPFDAGRPLPRLGGHFSGGFNVLFADGTVRLIPGDTPEATLKALITRNGGEMVTPP
jgi:prepilin-type processing-associated H-X9-DG protein